MYAFDNEYWIIITDYTEQPSTSEVVSKRKNINGHTKSDGNYSNGLSVSPN